MRRTGSDVWDPLIISELGQGFPVGFCFCGLSTIDDDITILVQIGLEYWILGESHFKTESDISAQI